MQFSSRLPIAVHILLAIVTYEGREKTTSTFLAGSVNVNPVIIRNTLGQLKAAGLVTVKAGEGGASLARAPGDITLMDVFDAVEKEEALFHFHENPNPECPVGKRVHAVLDSRLTAIQEAMRRQMAAVTLQELLDDMDRLNAEMAPMASGTEQA
ncbi:MAG: Rrf2 family transcriptional regulator [Aristaeellaceae bacterium]